MAEQEEGFVFVDKRRSANAEATSDADAQQEPQAPADAAPETAAQEEQPGSGSEEGPHPRLEARDRIAMCMDILRQGAWISLGLVLDPVTNQVEQDLNDARILIDGFADLAQRLEPIVDESIRRELRDQVAMLRMNYVKQAGKAG